MDENNFRIRRSGPQSFPSADCSSLPIDALTARYALNLLECAPFHTEFLAMVFDTMGHFLALQTVTTVFKDSMQQKEVKKLEEVSDLSELVRIVLGMLDKRGAHSSGDALRAGLKSALNRCLPEVSETSSYRKRTRRLQEVLRLSNEDMDLLECFAVFQMGGLFTSFLKAYNRADWIPLVAAALKLTPEAVRRRGGRGGSLASKGLLEIGSDLFEPNTALFDYLNGLVDDFFVNDDFSLVKRSEFSLESFPITENEQQLLIEILRNPAACHLFFYGRPGTGKTELAKALAAKAGKQAFLVKYGSDGTERDRRGAITATLGMAPSDAVVIIDEADGLLNTASVFQKKQVDKGWINNFIDGCSHKVIWISNRIGDIEESVLRRFAYSLQFKRFTASQRISAWNVQIAAHPLRAVIDAEMIDRLARDYGVDAGGIAASLRAVDGIFPEGCSDAASVEKTLGQLLEHHEKLSGIRRRKKTLTRLSPNYDVAALHTDQPTAELISALKAREKTATDRRTALPANIMFWGLPGTGKTEFAKYIAQELGKELLVKRMSDLQSMWVGETEKLIAAAFDEADREGAVLFLDEADSLILDRKTASRSWESSQTNEVLTQMENFNGICICCTNLLDGLDEAALRRFTWKLKFLPLTAEGAESLFRKYFQPTGRLSASVKTGLRAIRDLTPGDFKTVWQQQQYSGVKAAGLDVVKALKQECSYKRTRCSSPIGFSG
jgi:SpoVK/Ycf46/Vps4 family AAA+-type ATPase